MQPDINQQRRDARAQLTAAQAHLASYAEDSDNPAEQVNRVQMRRYYQQLVDDKQAALDRLGQNTKAIVHYWLVAINALLLVIGLLLIVFGSSSAGPWMGAVACGSFAFWFVRGVIYAFTNW